MCGEGARRARAHVGDRYRRPAAEELDQLERKRTQLEIEREALKKEPDDASAQRLANVDREIAELRSEGDALKARWDNEKRLISAVRSLRTVGIAGSSLCGRCLIWRLCQLRGSDSSTSAAAAGAAAAGAPTSSSGRDGSSQHSRSSYLRSQPSRSAPLLGSAARRRRCNASDRRLWLLER